MERYRNFAKILYWKFFQILHSFRLILKLPKYELYKNGGTNFCNIFWTVSGNDANDIPLERYWADASFLYRKFSENLKHFTWILKILSALWIDMQRMFCTVFIKRYIRMMEVIYRWIGFSKAQLYCIEHFHQFIKV